eukprot:1487755-Prymnesium_polylepis.1
MTARQIGFYLALAPSHLAPRRSARQPRLRRSPQERGACSDVPFGNQPCTTCPGRALHRTNSVFHRVAPRSKRGHHLTPRRTCNLHAQDGKEGCCAEPLDIGCRKSP